jgi:hypothetical protein
MAVTRTPTLSRKTNGAGGAVGVGKILHVLLYLHRSLNWGCGLAAALADKAVFVF